MDKHLFRKSSIERVSSPDQQGDYVRFIEPECVSYSCVKLPHSGALENGALMGAVFGPVVFLWIVFGSILGGAMAIIGVVVCPVSSGDTAFRSKRDWYNVKCVFQKMYSLEFSFILYNKTKKISSKIKRFRLFV